MQLTLRMPMTMQPSSAPELATLAIFEAAATASEALLCSRHDPFGHGADYSRYPRSTEYRAYAVILLCRRLSAALAAYREALDRETRRAQRVQRERHRDRPF